MSNVFDLEQSSAGVVDRDGKTAGVNKQYPHSQSGDCTREINSFSRDDTLT